MFLTAGRDKGSFCSLNDRDRLWGPPSLLFCRHRGLLLRGYSGRSPEADFSLPSTAEFKNERRCFSASACAFMARTGTTVPLLIIRKVKWSWYRPGVAQRVGGGIALLFNDRGNRRGEWSAARPGRTLPPGKTRYPFYRRLGGPQGRSGRAENLVRTGIRSRTVQPVVSRYTDWATRPTVYGLLHHNTRLGYTRF